MNHDTRKKSERLTPEQYRDAAFHLLQAYDFALKASYSDGVFYGSQAMHHIGQAAGVYGFAPVPKDDAEFFGIGLTDKSEPLRKVQVAEYKRRLDAVACVSEDDRDIIGGR